MNNHTEKPTRTCDPGYVALRDYFTLWLGRLEIFYNRRFEDLDTKTTQALIAADKAVSKAEAATEKRFEGVNEFRQTLSDQAAMLMPRQEALSKFDNIQKDLIAMDKAIQAMQVSGSAVSGRDLQRDQSRQDTSTKQAWMIPMIIAIGLGVVSMIMQILPYILGR